MISISTYLYLIFTKILKKQDKTNKNKYFDFNE